MVESAPLKTVDLGDVTTKSLEGNCISWLPTVDARVFLEVIWWQGQIGLQQVQVVHDSPALPLPFPPPLFFPTQTRNPLLHNLFDRKGNGLPFFNRRFLSSCCSIPLVDELVEVLVQLSFVFKTEGDVLASLSDLIYGKYFPPSQQLLYPFRLRMDCRSLALLSRLQQA